MPALTELGTARATPGEMSFGYVEMLELPTGITERLPVVLACGRRDGPTFWVTANIHGNEYTGLLAVQRAITEQLAGQLDRLRGTVVAVPTLNPAGLRVSKRHPYFDEETDPNRTFPTKKQAGEEQDEDPPTPYEQFSTRLYALMVASSDFHIDLHCAHLRSIPFTIRDRVLYRKEEEREEALRLAERVDGLARAFGLPVVTEFSAKRYLREKLHRSTGGALVHEARIPSITPELGATSFVDPAGLRAAIAGVRNALIWAEMLEGEPEKITWIPQPDLGYPVRRETHPYSPASGIAWTLRQLGEIVHPGEPIAELRDIWGRPMTAAGGDGLIRSEQEGWIIGFYSEVAVYRNSPIATLAVRDDEPLIARWPDEGQGG